MLKTRWILLVLLALAIIFSLAACGGDDDNGDPNGESAAPGELVAVDPWVRAASADVSGTNTAAFMTLQNDSGSDERLVQVTASDGVADVIEIHETTVDENDVMQMRPVNGILVPAGESVELKPGGLHIMFMGLQRDLTEGDTLSLTLTFESGLEQTLEIPIRSMTAME